MRTSLILIYALFLICPNALAMPYSGPNGHSSDYRGVFEGLKGANVSLLFKEVSSTIDRNPNIIVDGINFTCGNHRWFGHWGFEGSIPFNDDSFPLKNCIEKCAIGDKKKLKNAIISAWRDRVNQLTDRFVELTGLNNKQAKGFLGLLYNTHLLGDWKPPENKVLDRLVTPNKVANDITKNLHRVFSNNSNFVKDIQQEIERLKLPQNYEESQVYAQKLLGILKRHDIGRKFYEKYGEILAQKDISCKLINMTLKSSSKILPLLLSASYANINNAAGHTALKTSLKTGAIVSVFSGLTHGWKVVQGDEEVTDAIVSVAKDSTIATTSLYITDGLIQNIGGGKYALTAIIEEGVSASVKRVGAFLNFGVATFIFDETQCVFTLLDGEISYDAFLFETGKAIVKTGGSGAVAYCAVALSIAGPGSIAVMAISVATYTAINFALSYAEKLDNRNYLFIKDVLGRLPLEMQRRITPWDPENRITPWSRKSAATPWQAPDKDTPWSSNISHTPWD